MNVKYLLKKLLFREILNFNFLNSKFKKFVFRSIFEELQLTQISLNFKTSCCNVKISDVRANLCVAFSIILILKGIMKF